MGVTVDRICALWTLDAHPAIECKVSALLRAKRKPNTGLEVFICSISPKGRKSPFSMSHHLDHLDDFRRVWVCMTFGTHPESDRHGYFPPGCPTLSVTYSWSQLFFFLLFNLPRRRNSFISAEGDHFESRFVTNDSRSPQLFYR